MDAAASSDDGRKPDDKRPLLGDARQKFDERDYAGAIGILNSIVQSFPRVCLSPRRAS